jgi:hypothetical protein
MTLCGSVCDTSGRRRLVQSSQAGREVGKNVTHCLTTPQSDLGLSTVPESLPCAMPWGRPAWKILPAPSRRDLAAVAIAGACPGKTPTSGPPMSKRSKRHKQRPPKPDRSPVLSACTVLILSGFVLGMSIGSELPSQFQVPIFIVGLTGLVAYIGLDHVATRRRANAARREEDYFHDRLARHIDSNEGATVDHEELLELARQVTRACELHDLMPSRERSQVTCEQGS